MKQNHMKRAPYEAPATSVTRLVPEHSFLAASTLETTASTDNMTEDELW